MAARPRPRPRALPKPGRQAAREVVVTRALVVVATLLLLLLLEVANAFIAPAPLSSLQQPLRPALGRSRPEVGSSRRRVEAVVAPRQQRLSPLQWPLRAMGEEQGEEAPSTELGKLLDKDPSETGVLAYLGFVTVALLGLGIATFKFGGQLLGLGFASDQNFYWDSAPSYALLLVYPPLLLVFPSARGLLLKTLAWSFVVTAVIWAFPYDAIGWEPTNEHILITVGTPVLAYLAFFTWRATKTYLEIVEEEEGAQEKERGE